MSSRHDAIEITDTDDEDDGIQLPFASSHQPTSSSSHNTTTPDEQLAAQLQAEYDIAADAQYTSTAGNSQYKSIYKNTYYSDPQDGDAIAFTLNLINGIHNRYSLKFSDIFDNSDPSNPIQSLLLINYMIDVPYLLYNIHNFKDIPAVTVLHGERSDSIHHDFDDYVLQHQLRNWAIHRVKMRTAYSVSHSKIALIQYKHGLRVFIGTSNYLKIDVEFKNQAYYVQDFPLKTTVPKSLVQPASTFESDLLYYMESYKYNGIPSTVVNNTLALLKQHNFNYATCQLVFSIPGTYSQDTLYKCGHMHVKRLLQNERTDDVGASKQPVIAQISSMGNLPASYIDNDIIPSFSANTPASGVRQPPKLNIVWPTVDDLRTCIEGYTAGGSLCLPDKNLHDHLRFHHYDCFSTGRHNVSPHIKTWCRMINDNKLAYAYTGSANLSGAAWGKLQKNNTELNIKSYEIGVLFTRSLLHNLITHVVKNSNSDKSVKDILHRSYINYNLTNNSKLHFFCSDFGAKLMKADIDKLTVQLVLPQPIDIADIDIALMTNVQLKRIITDKLKQRGAAGDDSGERTTKRQRTDSDSNKYMFRLICPLPHTPYATPYSANDRAWTWDIPHLQPDIHGNVFQP